jgi:hypothetical protein
VLGLVRKVVAWKVRWVCVVSDMRWFWASFTPDESEFMVRGAGRVKQGNDRYDYNVGRRLVTVNFFWGR